MFGRAIIFCLIPAVFFVLSPFGSACAEESSGPVLAQEEQVDSRSETGPSLGGEADEEDHGRGDPGSGEKEPESQSEGGPALGGQSEEEEESAKGPWKAEEAPGTRTEPEGKAGQESQDREDREAIYRELQELREKVEQLEKEAEARKELRMTEEEKRQREEDILEAAGREFTLLEEGMLSMDLNVSYSYYSSDIIRENYEVEYQANHNLVHSLAVSTALLKNLSVSATFPFVYKYDRMGTEREKTVTDVGDISVGVKHQPWKANNRWPSPIFNLNLSMPTGRGQYEIDPDQDLGTGSGLYSLSAGASLSHPIDPVNVFGGLSYGYSFERDDIGQNRQQGRLEKVDPGQSISANMGFGYALSYRTSLSISYSYTYSFPTDYHWADGRITSGRETISSSLTLSTSWRINPKRTIIIGVSQGLTNDSQDFGLSLRLPLEFNLR